MATSRVFLTRLSSRGSLLQTGSAIQQYEVDGKSSGSMKNSFEYSGLLLA